MNNDNIESLRAALLLSPDNDPLRLLLAETLLSHGRLEEAEKEYAFLAKKQNNPKLKLGLATVYYKKEAYSACNVILEEIIEGANYKDIQNGNLELNIYVLYAKGLIKEKAIEKAIVAYKRVLEIQPHFVDEDLDNQLRNRGSIGSSNDDLDLDLEDHRFLEKPKINFDDVGGMDNVKKEIELKIIKPIEHAELYKAYGKKVGGGILLYGPPGCGKTFIAKATAGQVNAKFINVGLNDILDMWMGNSEKNLHEIFELARENTPCVLFIDEIDALGASRSDMKQSSSRHLINQFLQELDGISGSNEGVLIIGATNTPWNIDPAFRRPGRFDRIIFVPPPDLKSRQSILQLKLKGKPTTIIDYETIAKRINHYSGADIEALIDIAIEQKLEQSFKEGIPKPIETKDLSQAAKIHKASTQDWFNTAKNFALFANDSGLYDEILDYLKIKK